ncbi:MAG: tetratricopeptide repeat protein [Terriglobia bacterium]
MKKLSLRALLLPAIFLAGALLGTQALACAQASQRPSPQEAKNQALAAVRQGYALLQQTNLAGAEASFRSALVLDPKLAEACHGLGLTLWREGKQNDALRDLTRATQLDPSNPSFHLDVARAAWHMADNSQSSDIPRNVDSKITADSYRQLAIAEMQKALSLQPRDAQTHLSLAELYLELNQPKDAFAQAQTAAQLDPGDASAFVILGRADQEQGNDVAATGEYEKAIQLNPHDGESYLAIGELRLQQRDTLRAVEAFRSAIEASPGLALAYAALGQLLQQTHQAAEARGILEHAIALDPRDWQSTYELGKIMVQAGKAQEATTLFQKALQLHASFPAAREQLALQMLRRGDLTGAAAQAEAISVRNPQAPGGHRIMALVLWKQRNYDASLAECAMALQGDPMSLEMLAVQAIDLWQEGQRRESRLVLASAGKKQPDIVSVPIFCRLVVCDARDIDIINDFLRRNRWVVAPPPEP